jgi:hypothetical protein
MKAALRPLELDFWRTGRASPWAGRLLAIVALALAADQGLSYHRARSAIAAAELRIAALGRTPALARNAPQPSSEEIAAARETYQRLTIPWENLFRALESTATDSIALVGIEPDPKSGTVLISGQGADYLAAVSYMRNLEQSGALKSAHLVKHELRSGRNDRPVAFSISASWTQLP